MKEIKYIILILFVSLILSSCDEYQFGDAALERPPTITVNIDTVFSRIEYAQRFLWGAYDDMHYGILTRRGDAQVSGAGNDPLEALTDLAHAFDDNGGAMRLYYNGQYAAGTEEYPGKATIFNYITSNTWVGIRKCYIFLENISRVPDASTEEIEMLKAEARVLIAIFYSDMFRHLGSVPWIDHAYTPAEDTYLPRLKARDMVDSIVNIIDLAIPHLPWQVEDLSNWDGRLTKASAMGLKARLLLFAASPLFNDDVPYLDGEAAQELMVWFGSKDPSLWDDAAQAAIELIDAVEGNGAYSLVNTGDHRQDFQDAYYARGNGEVLISVRDRFKSGSRWSKSYYFYQASFNYGAGIPTHEYAEMFGMDNGLPISDPASGYDPTDPFINRDPRLYETALVNGDSYQGRTAENWIGGRERTKFTTRKTKTGYGLRKFLLENNTATSYNSIVHWPYLRMAEIYLSAAEALNEANSGPTAKAYEYVDHVRARVGLNGLPAGLSHLEFREAVLEERAKELGYEEVRWFDLVRWKREEDFTKKLHGIEINLVPADSSFTYTIVDLPPRYWQENWSPKWYLSAFPPSEVFKDYGLVQNPGW
ncbi:MAG: RagB/SusD family nutrient uptake outer membrane protein [Bacteroidota bacterium]